MDDVRDTKYANQARLESWLAGVETGRVVYNRQEDGRWIVVVEATRGQSTVIVTSGPRDSMEAGCVAAIDALRDAHQTIP